MTVLNVIQMKSLPLSAILIGLAKQAVFNAMRYLYIYNQNYAYFEMCIFKKNHYALISFTAGKGEARATLMIRYCYYYCSTTEFV